MLKSRFHQTTDRTDSRWLVSFWYTYLFLWWCNCLEYIWPIYAPAKHICAKLNVQKTNIVYLFDLYLFWWFKNWKLLNNFASRWWLSITLVTNYGKIAKGLTKRHFLLRAIKILMQNYVKYINDQDRAATMKN